MSKEQSNYEMAYKGLKKLFEQRHSDDVCSKVAQSLQVYASLAVADELRTLNELLRSFGLGDTQGGRTFEVSVKK
jgi:hypothetical protein